MILSAGRRLSDDGHLAATRDLVGEGLDVAERGEVELELPPELLVHISVDREGARLKVDLESPKETVTPSRIRIGAI